MWARHLPATQLLGPHSQTATDHGVAIIQDSASILDLVFIPVSASTRDSALADAGDVVGLAGVGDGVSASVGAGIHGGDGVIRTIHTRTVRTHIGEVMAGTMILRRTVRT